MRISVDFNKKVGKIKPMHAVGQPPYLSPYSDEMHYLREANIPYARLHDMGGPYGGFLYVDIPNIFRDFNADEALPESYDFAFTDVLLKRMREYGVEPVYRLGVTIENYPWIKSYRISPPSDYEKWARVCEHIIRHYNQGWDNGFYMNIKYWEIWNEPDNDMADLSDNMMWTGTAEDYYRLYEVTANHLKSCFGDSIKVGGYASCGFYSMDKDPECKGFDREPDDRFDKFISFFHGFLKYITSDAHKSPLDFFSWHSYADVHTTLKMEDYCRKVLAGYGLSGVEDMLNEWNTCHDNSRFGTDAAAQSFAMMLGMQKKPVAMMNFYDARIRNGDYEGLFNSETRLPLPNYYAFMSFGRAYRLGYEAHSESDDENVFAVAATDVRHGKLLIANINSCDVEAEIDTHGVGNVQEILAIDSKHIYSPTGWEIIDGKLTLPKYSCVEICYDLDARDAGGRGGCAKGDF